MNDPSNILTCIWISGKANFSVHMLLSLRKGCLGRNLRKWKLYHSGEKAFCTYINLKSEISMTKLFNLVKNSKFTLIYVRKPKSDKNTRIFQKKCYDNEKPLFFKLGICSQLQLKKKKKCQMPIFFRNSGSGFLSIEFLN